jgi:predicted phosphoribosyltransferase
MRLELVIATPVCVTSLMKGDREMMAKMVVCSRHDDFLLVEIVYLGV